MQGNEEFSSDCVDVVQALIASGLSSPEPRDATDAQLARFVVGWITADEEAQMLEALVASPALRKRLIAINAESHGDLATDHWPFMAEALRTSARTYLRLSKVFAGGFETALARRSGEAVAALAALRIVGESLRTPSKWGFATTRSRGPDAVELDGQGGYIVSTEGDEAYLCEPFGGELPLPVSQGGLIADLGNALGTPDDELPAGTIVVECPTPTPGGLKLLRLDSPGAWMELTDRPAVRNGRFTVSLRLSDQIRTELANKRVGIAIRVGERWIHLIAARQVELGGDRLVLSTQFDGIEDGEFQLLSVLRVVVA